jgi:hypothetical protein
VSNLPSESTKVCLDCGEVESLDEFPPQAKRGDGRGLYCRPCMNVRSQASRYKRRAAEGRPVTPRVECPPGFKRCPDCDTVKAVNDFPRNKGMKDGLGGYCKPCHNIRGKATVERLYGSNRHYHLVRRYGITEAEYDSMLEEQGGLCAICGEQAAGHVDHDHVTGKVRGLTCFNCNGGLGQFRDRVDIMLKAIDYLERNQTPQWQKTLVSAGVYRITTRPPATAASARSSLPPRPTSFPPV